MGVVLLRKPVGHDGHYLDLLHKSGIHPILAGQTACPEVCTTILRSRDMVRFLRSLPGPFLPYTIDILGELLAAKPHIVHAWLDHTNMYAGIAAVLAGIPVIVLSTRNVNPSHFPFLYSPLFKPWYRLLAECPRVHFVNNSAAGARSYADWLELPLERFHVIRNGLDFATVQRPEPSAIELFRRSLRLPEKAILVAGIFRLSEEKNPTLFLEVLRRVMAKHDHICAAIAGVGPCDHAVRQTIRTFGLAQRIHLLGRRKDVAVILGGADIVLHTSNWEGIPNALLEAQWLGRPVVATRAGGTPEAVAHNKTGFLADVGDADGLTQALLRLIENPPLRKQLGEAGPSFIQSHFAVSRMVTETVALYRQGLAQIATIRAQHVAPRQEATRL